VERLQKTSRRLQEFVLIIMVLLPAATMLTVVLGEWGELLNLSQDIPIDTSNIRGVSLLVVIVIGLIKPIATIIAFGFLYKLLSLYRQGIVFMMDNVTAIRNIGWALMGVDIASMFQTLITGPVLTIFKITPGHIIVRIEVGFLVVGLFIVLVSYVMDIGRELKERDDLVI